jgi:hypothetical protein
MIKDAMILRLLCVLLLFVSALAQADFSVQAGVDLSPQIYEQAKSLLHKHMTENYSKEFIDQSKLKSITFVKQIVLANGSQAGGLAVGSDIQISLADSLILLEQQRPALLERIQAQQALALANEKELADLNLVQKWDCSIYARVASQVTWCEEQKQKQQQLIDSNRAILISNRAIFAQNIKNIEDFMERLTSWVGLIFDHELFHVIDYAVLRGYNPKSSWNAKWLAINPVNFNYFGDDQKYIAAHGDNQKLEAPYGFVTAYATSEIAEDKAETFCYFMRDPEKFMQEHASNPIILGKLKQLELMLKSGCDYGRKCTLPKPFLSLENLE